jgi:hypothetical protein
MITKLWRVVSAGDSVAKLGTNGVQKVKSAIGSHVIAPVLGLVCAIRGDETHRRDHKDDEGFKGH